VPSSWKYAGNLETLARMIREHCSNPRLQLVKLFQRVLFCWVTGNGDMHLKNWSLIERGPLIELSPAYDLLNTKLLIDDEDESAIALNERNSGFDRQLLVDYFGRDICGINERMINKTIQQLAKVDWNSAIRNSHVSDEDRVAYSQLVDERLNCLAHMGN
jgi:serine/threonine-protein kinase HipA